MRLVKLGNVIVDADRIVWIDFDATERVFDAQQQPTGETRGCIVIHFAADETSNLSGSRTWVRASGATPAEIDRLLRP